MSTKLKAGTSTSGAVIDADTTGILELQTGSTPTTAITVDANQNVGVGTASPQSRFHVASSSAESVLGRLQSTGSTASYMGFGGSGATNLYDVACGAAGTNIFAIRTSDTERMRINSSGDVLIGQASASAPPTSSADIFFGGMYINPSRRTTGSGANTFWDSSSGAFFRSTSSLKYKTDVIDATYGLSEVLKLRPVTYKGKAEADTGKLFGGFIAEEVDALGLKEFVEYDSEGSPDSLAYANMVSLLTKAIQEQQVMIEELKTKVAALEAK